MEEFQKRMLVEYKELNARWKKLHDFIESNPLFDKLDKQERLYQVHQLIGMDMYRTALIGRLVHHGLLKEIDAINGEYPEHTPQVEGFMASHLASALNDAVKASGDKPVINSRDYPIPSGGPVNRLVYGEENYELE